MWQVCVCCTRHTLNRGVSGASEHSERDADPRQRNQRELSEKSRPAIRVLGFLHRLRLSCQVRWEPLEGSELRTGLKRCVQDRLQVRGAELGIQEGSKSIGSGRGDGLTRWSSEGFEMCLDSRCTSKAEPSRAGWWIRCGGCVCVYVCVCVRKRDGDRDRDGGGREGHQECSKPFPWEPGRAVAERVMN